MDKISIIKNFVVNNKLLSLILSVALILIILLLFTKNTAQNNIQNESLNKSGENAYTLIKETSDYSYYIEYGKYYVTINMMSLNDKEQIRAALEIPQSIDFEVVIPGALLREDDVAK
jgi:hypothetical protein